MDLSGHGLLITGGTRGIGLALAKACLSRGARVAVCGRSARRIDTQGEGLAGIVPFACDLSQASRLPTFVEEVRARFGPPSILVNNAGIQHNYLWPETPSDDIVLRVEREVRTNLTSLLALTGSFLPDLSSHPEAAIVNVTSALALAPKRSAAVYSATKAAVRSFSRALRYQLGEGSTVRVVEVVPPVVETEMTRGRGGHKMKPEKVARKIVRGLERDREEIWIGAARLLRILHRLSPALAARLVRDS